MTVSAATKKIRDARLVAIIRLDDPGLAEAAAHALFEGGIDVLEFSLAAPGALEAIRRVAGAGLPLLVGAGTVLGVPDAEAAVAAGARWLVSPGLDVDTVAWGREHDVLHIPGALTPTEIGHALRAGAGLIKLFPAAVVGPRYLTDLRGPFPRLQLVPTGGVDADNMNAYLDAGAAAVAVGSSLVNAASAAAPELLAQAARRMRDAADPVPFDRLSKESHRCP
ncbi:MAG: 2-dehydro-3-deoxyphosphogluconate aldolase/4-hydroxy-2-oxoglutarate aldolase [Conexibacter sp.]|nr:2-dehydro-3-deoxyphosphogluconate aldolase/4-hydroxy-2-oxoglutarate aldolase [Conexibacter sp.]